MENIDETPIWKSIDELIAESNKTHYVESDYLGQKIRFGWKEVSQEDNIETPKTEKQVKEMSEDEKNIFIRDAFELVVFAMINKVGKDATCTNENVVTRDQWMKMPMRIRMDIMLKVGNYQNQFKEDFLSQSKKT